MKSRSVFIVGVLLFTSLFACKKVPEKIISINPSEFTTEQQIKIGNVFREAINNSPGAFDILKKQEFPQAYQYLSTLFNTMRNTPAVKHRNAYDWSVTIVRNDSLHTAFFLPGGHFYIYTGLLKYLDRESQLLGVIGHELHYADTDVLIKKMSSEFGGTTLGDIILDNEVENLDELAASMPFLSFSEPQVLNADLFAIELICPFQYEPHGIKTILEKESPGESGLLWLNTRQANQHFRINQIEQASASCGFPGIGNESNYRKFKEEYLP